MVVLSEFALIAVFEVFAVLLLAVGALLYYNSRLHKKGKSLATQLHQLKDTTRFLLTKVNEFSENTYATFLARELSSAREQAPQLFSSDDLLLLGEQQGKDKAFMLRYLLLQAEHSTESIEDEEEKAAARMGHLEQIVTDFEPVAGTDEIAVTEAPERAIDQADLKQKWGYLVDAALSLVKQRTFDAEDDLLDIVAVINQDLGMADVQMPKRDDLGSKGSQSVEQVKKEADRNREVIQRLLAERSAAEAEINVKVSELEQMQRFLTESEVCINLLESELSEARKALDSQQDASDHDPAEMQQLIQRFSRESSEMLNCIATLEQENDDLKAQLGKS